MLTSSSSETWSAGSGARRSATSGSGDEAAGVEVRELVGEGPPAKVLLESAKDADLLVIGSRGRGGFASAVLGSVSLACVLHARCPVLVFRGKEDDDGADKGGTGS